MSRPPFVRLERVPQSEMERRALRRHCQQLCRHIHPRGDRDAAAEAVYQAALADVQRRIKDPAGQPALVESPQPALVQPPRAQPVRRPDPFRRTAGGLYVPR